MSAGLTLIHYSPTRTTAKVLQAIARGMGSDGPVVWDLTPPGAETRDFPEITGGAAVLGVPVYGGRVPVAAARRLRRLKARGVPAVLVAVYGNRAFEDALVELADMAQEQGFLPVAGAAFIGEHSYSTDKHPLAVARPDASDLAKAEEFGRLVARKLGQGEAGAPDLPGDRPYKERVPRKNAPPVVDEALCTACGTCAEVCPVAAVTVEDVSRTDKDACTFCAACVKECPAGARSFQGEFITTVRNWLTGNCAARKEPETFL